MHVGGNPDAFNCLLRRHRDRLAALARSIAGDDAEDAVQDAMIKAYQNAAKFRGESKVYTWLHRIVVNASLDIVRRRGATMAELPEIPQEPEGAFGWPVTGRVARILTLEQKQALMLVDVMQYPVSEASVILGIPEGTVKSRCARGRELLARVLPGRSRRRSA